MGALFPIPFTGSNIPLSELHEAFQRGASTDIVYDALIIGGSFAGLSAAMGLGRCLRSVLLVDEGKARNRTSPQANNVFSRDGQNPGKIREEAKMQLQQYKEYLNMIEVRIKSVSRDDPFFRVMHEDGNVYRAKHVIFASGVTDELQDIEGLAELWRRGVYHCPYCHGWENRGKKTVVIGQGTSAMGLASTVSNWTNDITYFSQSESINLPEETQNLLKRHGITIREEKVGRISKTDEEIQIRLLETGDLLRFEACYAPGIITGNSQLAESLGCELQPNGAIEVNESYLTDIPNVYAIGDVCSRSNGQVIHAAYSGTVVAATINRTMLEQRFV